MRTFLASGTVLFTIFAAFAFGIACGYVAIIGILKVISHKPQQESAAPATAVIATGASGH